MKWCTTIGPLPCGISVSSYKLSITTTGSRKPKSCEANPTSRVDPRNDLKTGKNPEATPKGKSPENLKPGPDLVGKLGKDGKLTPQECQCCMDNSLCLFCGKTGHIAKECPKSTAIAARAHATVTELQESFVKEAKKD